MTEDTRNDFEPLMTVEEVADYIKFEPSTIRQWVKARSIPHLKVGRSTRFRRQDIDAWVDRAKVMPPTEGAA